MGDQIELPCKDEIDYSQFSIFFSINEAIQPDYMVNQLRQFPKDRWIKMWRQFKKISHHFEFQYPPNERRCSRHVMEAGKAQASRGSTCCT
ncbi:hypothetical protein BDE02_10G204000 [Populus trichocarpa]|jgi:hypothetical protein|nr:hypothetical protein BDE02_10G204000 [Populus trichocarpa]